ncbi:MAG: ADP-ribosylglycohydrolase family protein, partial [Actinobacteria bacterium]|nr:ADP-ribosylglycohydrolase family protein [Actinomycetota bacterium]
MRRNERSAARDRRNVSRSLPAAFAVLVVRAIGTDVRASHSVAAALWIAAVAGDYEEGVVLALAVGGDVDTIAAMACAVLGAAAGGDAIPTAWTQWLEN